MLPKTDTISLLIFVDQSIIEVFSLDGRYAITDQVFPTQQKTSVELNGNVKLINGWLLKVLD